MTQSSGNPKLRWPLELKIERIDNQEILLVRCPLGISEQPLLLVPQVAPIVSCLDGRMSIDEIQVKFAPYGVKRELVVELVNLLDNHLFLDGERFTAAERKVKDEFTRSEIRPSYLAGLGFSDTPVGLRTEVEKYLGLIPTSNHKNSRELVCLVSPHIDYRRGQISYGHAYSRLKDQTHDLYILAGTSHQYSPHMFHLTKKHFANPLGTMSADQEFVEQLAKIYGHTRSFSDEFLHRREHSLELQIPFLQHLRPQAKIVPILVGSFFNLLQTGKVPTEAEEYEAFAAALCECLSQRLNSGGKICFIAGVDMAHIGRAFGDPGTLNPKTMEQIEARDRGYLQAIINRDPSALFNHIAEDNDARRICGFPTMYLILDVLKRLGIYYSAELFHYRQAVDYDSDCAVTFAGLGMYRKSHHQHPE